MSSFRGCAVSEAVNGANSEECLNRLTPLVISNDERGRTVVGRGIVSCDEVLAASHDITRAFFSSTGLAPTSRRVSILLFVAVRLETDRAPEASH